MKSKLSLFLVVLTAVLFSLGANAAQIVYKNMYSQHDLVQGRGKTKDAAQKDAESSIPQGFVADPGNSPTVQCRIAGAIATSKCNDPKDEVLFTIALVKQK